MKIRSAIEINNLKDYKETKLQKYPRLIDKLIYLVYGIRPNIVFVVDQLSKHNANYRKSHLQAAKRVVRYLKGTMQMGFVFGKEVNSHFPRDPPLYGFIRYVDKDFAKDLVD